MAMSGRKLLFAARKRCSDRYRCGLTNMRNRVSDDGLGTEGSPLLIHSVFVVFVGKTAENLQLTVRTEQCQRGMVYSVEHTRLYGGVVYHVLKDDFLAYAQRMVKFPCTHEVPRQTGIATETIYIR